MVSNIAVGCKRRLMRRRFTKKSKIMVIDFEKKDITLLFAGGTEIMTSKDTFLIIEDGENIKKWIKNIPELEFVANLETQMIIPESTALNFSTKSTRQIIDTIFELRNQNKNIILTYPLDDIPMLPAYCHLF